MKEIFNDILSIGDVKGAIFIDKKHEIKIEAYTVIPEPDLSKLDLAPFIRLIGAHRETELHYDNLKLYIRKIKTGHILVLTDFNVQMAMVRLNCDVLEPLIKSKFEKPTGIGRFSKK